MTNYYGDSDKFYLNSDKELNAMIYNITLTLMNLMLTQSMTIREGGELRKSPSYSTQLDKYVKLLTLFYVNIITRFL